MTTAPASERSSLVEGATVADYVLLERLGEGGMGVVFKAEDTKLRRVVALKLLHPRVAEDPDKRRRFLREGRLTAHLTHPCIATVHQVGEADGRIFIAMELCHGKSLKRVLQEQRILPYTDALHVFREITRGLRKAHEAGVIHRDLKPDNVMIDDDGIVKVLDFGVAKPTEQLDINVTDLRTQHGAMVGTPAYMSPEQATGKKVDARSDIFSLGVVLYELLTGRRPFQGETWQDIIISINRDAPTPASALRPDLPPEVDAVLARCMAKRPDDRYGSCKELLEDVERLQAGAGMVRSGIISNAGASLPPPPDAMLQTPIPSGASTGPRPIATTTTGATAPARGGKGLLIGGAIALLTVVAGAAFFAGRGATGGGVGDAAASAGQADRGETGRTAGEPAAPTAQPAAPTGEPAAPAQAAADPSAAGDAPEPTPTAAPASGTAAPASGTAAPASATAAPIAAPAPRGSPPRGGMVAPAPKPADTPAGAATATATEPAPPASAKPKNEILGF